MTRGQLAAAIAGILLFSGVALATGTRSFRQSTAKDFEEGQATGSMILPNGTVVPGMQSSRLALDASFAWCATLARDGRTAFFGTGDQGRIFALPTASGDSIKRVAELDTPWVTALLARPDESLIAGSTPGGRLFVVDPRSGSSRPFATLPAEHVWALMSDAKAHTIYAATGRPGKIFAINDKGQERLLWDSGDQHILSLASGGEGVLLAGTADQAILYRVYLDGHAEAVHDFEATEIRAIARAGHASFLAVNEFEKGNNEVPSSGAQPGKRTKIVPGPAPASGAAPRGDQAKAKGAVFRLDDDGHIEQLLALPDGYFTALLAVGNDIFAASGREGKVYRIAPDRSVAMALDLPERQALALAKAADGFLVGTGDAAAIFRARPAVPKQSSYLSKVLDAEGPALWGHLHWTGSPGLLFETHSGNTAKPDKSWTEWKKVQAPSQHADEGQGAVGGHSSRYLQYRVTLPSDKSVLREVVTYFLPQNQRARVTEVYLADSGTAPSSAGGASGTPVSTAARSHSSVLKLRWKLENPDNDELIFRLWFRSDDESVWRPLAGPDPLSKAEYDWNTESVPDGRYHLRVWASDAKVTPSDRALDFTFDSPSFLVDNTRPEVTDLHRDGTLIRGKAHDAASIITQVEYSVDGNDWRPASPTDLLFDERSESFWLPLPAPLASGPHIVTVRAWDAADNQGVSRIEVQGHR